MEASDLDCAINLVQHWLAESHLLAIAPVTTHRAPLLPKDELQQRAMHFNAPILSPKLPSEYEAAPTRAAVKLCKPVTKKQHRLQQAALAQIFEEAGSVTMVSHLHVTLLLAQQFSKGVICN